MANYELKLQQDNTILTQARNLNWDLQNMQADLVIQFRAHLEHDQNNNNNNVLPRPHAATATKKLLYMQEASNFLTDDGMSQLLTNILEDEGITADADGQLLCDGGLQLLRPDGSRMLAFPQSVRIYMLSKLVDCVLRHVKWLSFSPRNRSVKFVPISIDLSHGSW